MQQTLKKWVKDKLKADQAKTAVTSEAGVDLTSSAEGPLEGGQQQVVPDEQADQLQALQTSNSNAPVNEERQQESEVRIPSFGLLRVVLTMTVAFQH